MEKYDCKCSDKIKENYREFAAIIAIIIVVFCIIHGCKLVAYFLIENLIN